MQSTLMRTALATAALAITLTAGAITPGSVLHPTAAQPSAPRTAPRAAPQAAPRTEGDTNPPPYDRRAFTEQTVRLSWKGTTAAGRARMCAHPDSFISPALDARYAAQLIRAECRAH
ncbi:hypothetical protein OHB13_30400 [Streptomyces sp. NBC_00440]|uniref:hypothetical protein n=1 Tax=unclassified Streptomyces TaxID=2593676 RepID=UPI002E218E8E|nr:hypothetical protein OG221_07070 [Streptomyces sp. NBC_00932]